MQEVESGKEGSIRYREKHERSLEDKNEWNIQLPGLDLGGTSRKFHKKHKSSGSCLRAEGT